MSKSAPEINFTKLILSTGIGVFMAVVDSSVVNISLYRIANSLEVSIDIAQWTILVYLLTLSGLMLIAGDFGDRFGNKKIFQIGLIFFSLSSLLCSISQSIEMLIFFRILQATGASFIMANGVAIVTKFTSKGSRGKAIGWNSLIVSSGLVVGPLFGGILTELFGWQSIFLINVPIGIIGYFLVDRSIPTIPGNKEMKKIDIVGASLFACFIIISVLSITIIKDLSTDTMMFITLAFIISLGIGFLFIIWSKYSLSPILDLELFKNRTFLFSIIASVSTFTIIQVIIFQLPYFLQGVMNLSPLEASFTIIGIPLMMALTGPWAGRLSDKIEPRYISTVGIIGIGLVIFILGLLISKNTDIILITLLMFGFGITIGIFASPNSNSIMSSVPKHNAGIAGSLLALARNLGFSVGIGLSTAVLILFQKENSIINGGELVDAINYIPAFQLMLFLFSIIIIVPLLTSLFSGNNYYTT